MLNSVTLIIVCLVAAPLSAQSVWDSPKIFIDVSVAPDWDDARNNSTRVPGATLNSGITLGFDSTRSGLEIGIDVPQWHVNNRPPYRYQYGGTSYGFSQQNHFYESLSTIRRRSIGLTMLHRANVPLNRHATFTWLVGGAYVYRPEQTTNVTSEVLPDGTLTVVNTRKTTRDQSYVAACARLDVELRITPHVSIVPRLRAMAFPSFADDSGLAPRIFTARPEVTARWRF